MDYREKLEDFNRTQKYKNEMVFVTTKLMNETVLDYGCGIGTFHKYLNARTHHSCCGYDPHLNDYLTEDLKLGMLYGMLSEEKYTKKFHNVTFMHSIAHINSPMNALKELALEEGGRIVIFTPNGDWLNLMSKQEYIPDPTVVCHYTMNGLISLVESAGYKVVEQGQYGEVIENQKERIYIVAQL